MPILVNNYAPDYVNQPGDQPIRIFYPYFEDIYLTIKQGLINGNPESTIILSNNKFKFLTENIKAIAPSCSEKQISIYDTFLSFLWAYTYGFIILTPEEKGLTDLDKQKASDLLNYALLLINSYDDWDKEQLPNPELYENNDEKIGKVNGVFLMSIHFIFYHELAHIGLGHLKELQINGPNVSLARRKQMEFEADNFATRATLSLAIDENSRDVIEFAIISSLCALTFTSDKFDGGRFHPDPDHRIKAVLEKLDYPDKHPIWGVAGWGLMQWQVYFKGKINLVPHEYTTPKQWFYDILSLIDNYKKGQV